MAVQWLHTIDETGDTPLMRASKSGRTEVTNLMLMQEQNDDPKFFRELPALHRAASWGFDDVIFELIEDGSDVSEMDARGETALHKASRLGNFDAAKALLNSGAEVNARDALGMTALHWAALTGNEPLTELLLTHYADVDARDYFAGGITPSGIAKLMGYGEVQSLMKNRFTFF